MNSATALLAAAHTASAQGPGNTVRIVLAVSLVGAVLVGWFLLRGYGGGNDD